MKIFCIAVIFGIFLLEEGHALICKNNFQTSKSALQRTKNEQFLMQSFQGDTAALFLHNFKNGNMDGENNFIVLRGTSSIGRIVEKVSDVNF